MFADLEIQIAKAPAVRHILQVILSTNACLSVIKHDELQQTHEYHRLRVAEQGEHLPLVHVA